MIIDDRDSRDEGELTTATLAERAQPETAPRPGPMAEQESGTVRWQEQQQTAERPPRAGPMPEGEQPDGSAPLFPGREAEEMRRRWSDIQASFVDEPRRAVEQADYLVANAIKRLAESFADERSRLEAQWDRGGDVETEDLRQALRRYRSFFDRLLSV